MPRSTPADDRLLSIPEAVQAFPVFTEGRLRALIKARRVGVVRIARHVYLPEGELRRVLADSYTPPRPPRRPLF